MPRYFDIAVLPISGSVLAPGPPRSKRTPPHSDRSANWPAAGCQRPMATVVGLGPVLLNALSWILGRRERLISSPDRTNATDGAIRMNSWPASSRIRTIMGHRGTCGPWRFSESTLPRRLALRGVRFRLCHTHAAGLSRRLVLAANPITKAARDLTPHPCNCCSGNSLPERRPWKRRNCCSVPVPQILRGRQS